MDFVPFGLFAHVKVTLLDATEGLLTEDAGRERGILPVIFLPGENSNNSPPQSNEQSSEKPRIGILAAPACKTCGQG
jgi:hypothetical protein